MRLRVCVSLTLKATPPRCPDFGSRQVLANQPARAASAHWTARPGSRPTTLPHRGERVRGRAGRSCMDTPGAHLPTTTKGQQLRGDGVLRDLVEHRCERESIFRSTAAAQSFSEGCCCGPTGRPQAEHVWIGSVLRLPERVDVRRSASRRLPPAASGNSVRQTAAAARISSTLLATRMPRRSGPSYSRTSPRRCGAFQYSHRNTPVRQTMANRCGNASEFIGTPGSIPSSDELCCKGIAEVKSAKYLTAV